MVKVDTIRQTSGFSSSLNDKYTRLLSSLSSPGLHRRVPQGYQLASIQKSCVSTVSLHLKHDFAKSLKRNWVLHSQLTRGVVTRNGPGRKTISGLTKKNNEKLMLTRNGEEEARFVNSSGLKRMQMMLGLRQDREKVPEKWEASRKLWSDRTQ